MIIAIGILCLAILCIIAAILSAAATSLNEIATVSGRLLRFAESGGFDDDDKGGVE